MPEHRLARCRAAYAAGAVTEEARTAARLIAEHKVLLRNFTAYQDVCVPEFLPEYSDDLTVSPDHPPRHDDVWDQQPILERGWNVIEGETD